MSAASTAASITAAAALVLLGLACALPVEAGEPDKGPPTRLAAVGSQPAPASQQRILRGPVSDGEERLFAQAIQSSTADRPEGDGTILVLLDASTPESAEGEIAREYELQLIEPSLHAGLRIARYRIPDSRSPATVIESLQADWRIKIVQANLQHRQPETAPTAVSSLDQGAGTAGKRSVEQSQFARSAIPIKKAQAKPAQQIALAEPAERVKAREHRSRPGRSLASGSQTALRFPTADEPFVNVGATNR